MSRMGSNPMQCVFVRDNVDTRGEHTCREKTGEDASRRWPSAHQGKPSEETKPADTFSFLVVEVFFFFLNWCLSLQDKQNSSFSNIICKN